MPSRSIRNEADLTLLFRWLKGRKRPFTVDVKDGRKRSIDQNRLAHLWFKEAAEQLGDRTPSDVRAWAKLYVGIPILREENKDFKAKYDRLIRPHSVEDKLEMMVEPFDFPVTRLMTTEQGTRFLEQVEQKLLEMGIALTQPEQRRAA